MDEGDPAVVRVRQSVEDVSVEHEGDGDLVRRRRSRLQGGVIGDSKIPPQPAQCPRCHDEVYASSAGKSNTPNPSLAQGTMRYVMALVGLIVLAGCQTAPRDAGMAPVDRGPESPGVGTRHGGLQSAEFRVEGMTDAEAARIGQTVLEQEHGVVAVRADVERGILIATFDPMVTSTERLGDVLLRRAGLQVTDVVTAGDAAGGERL
jgi:hypothetical protein